jgi:putative ATP-dependent DNA ligase
VFTFTVLLDIEFLRHDKFSFFLETDVQILQIDGMNTTAEELPEILHEALSRHKARWEKYDNTQYLRMTDDFRGYAKGTVMFAGRLIPGYPHIGRIYRLEQGLRQQFPGPFWVEEKIDGYNVRAFRHENEILALTRGGFVCPFSTDRISDLVDTEILLREPDLILCAEVAGPDNPYAIGSPPFVERDVRAYVFDMMRVGTAGFVIQADKTELTERYGLPVPRQYGRFTRDRWRELSAIMKQLDQEGREGVVFKQDVPNGHRTKYVTRNSGIYDIAVRASDMVELPGDFFTGRILRMALFMDEAGLERDAELHRRLGEALLDGLFESLDGFKRQGGVFHTFRCRFRRRANAEAFMHHLRGILGHTHLWQRRLEREGNYWLLEFDKEVPKLTGLMHQLFRGDAFID